LSDRTFDPFMDRVLQGDCLDVLKGLPDNCMDAIVTDPPAGISFMGKDWDGDKGGRNKWITWLAKVMRECLRVTKPGGHALVWSLPRTSHRTGTALEEAGWEVRDCITHIFGSGFPKSHNLAGTIDKLKGYPNRGHRIAIASRYHPDGTLEPNGGLLPPYEAKSLEAQPWVGYGTALKPSAEFWWLARKPLSEKTLAANCLRWGTGGLAIDRCRVAMKGEVVTINTWDDGSKPFGGGAGHPYTGRQETSGRWPSNCALTHGAGCRCVGTRRVKGTVTGRNVPKGHWAGGFTGQTNNEGVYIGYADADGCEEIEAWECEPDCPITMLDRQSGERPGSHNQKVFVGRNGGIFPELPVYDGKGKNDSGGASRFFPQFAWSDEDAEAVRFLYCAKAARRERWFYCTDCQEAYPPGDKEQHGHGHVDAGGKQTWEHLTWHPTQKPLKLMRWLVRLVLPPGGVTLDPFLGTGTAALAAKLEGFHYIGIDSDPISCRTAERRLAALLL
jgi:site-specific DNA-methyltransferase (adenine-specific)